ncbi:MAG: ankyrin repeat domain-containing protein [Gemmatimonadaceae bacterium]
MMSIPAADPQATAVVGAIQAGDVGALQDQLNANPELAQARIIDGGGVARTLLHVAADWPGHFPNGSQIVGALIAAGAQVNACVIHPDSKGSPETALHWAASSDDVSVIDALLDGGADIEATGAVFTGGSAMSDAVVFAQWNAAQRLLERGAATTIWQAAALGLLQRVQEFTALDPPPEDRDITNAFWHACRSGQRSTAEFLLERGADLNWVGYDRRTPLNAAILSGNKDLVAWLHERGAKRARP